MGTAILHLGAKILCSHEGTATPNTPFARVKVSSQPVITLSTTHTVVGCSLTGTPVPPCVAGQFVVGASRVMAGGMPVATMPSSSVCTPTGTPMVPVSSQTRVLAT